MFGVEVGWLVVVMDFFGFLLLVIEENEVKYYINLVWCLYVCLWLLYWVLKLYWCLEEGEGNNWEVSVEDEGVEDVMCLFL